MTKISKNFSWSEFSYSTTANQKGIDNTIPTSVKPAIQSFVNNLLQPLCDRTGWQDVISSGYRSQKLNVAVGGVESSQHRTGEAADNKFYFKYGGKTYYIKPISVLHVLLASGLDFDQAILYDTFIHLSYTTKRANRRQVLYNSSYKGERL
ncbi:MAG: D-Ala-D-Ala carboxypeptidase family metallohydrolase [Tannerellaceae bacterium]|nr:D-Ala-D-Ala carboxypeptidase family metallohydrolase [Tannerellaceae bacterium]